MSKCNAFGRDAHMSKIHKLAPGELYSPRRKGALLGDQVVTPRRVEDAIKAANVAIERREARADYEAGQLARFVRWLKSL